MHLRTPSGNVEEFQILVIFPFTSESKRMGIIVQDTATGEIMFVMKGADVVMANIGEYVGRVSTLSWRCRVERYVTITVILG